LEQVLVGIVLIGGALAGGVVSYLFGPSPTFWLNGFSFLAAAWIISTIKILKPIHHHEDQDNKKESLSLSLKHVILLSIPLQIILLCELLVPLVNGIDNVLISVYAVEIFHLGNVGVGTFYGALGIGLIASFPVANRIKKHYLLIGLSCLFFEGCMMLFLSHAYSTLLAVMIFCSSAFFSGIGNACLDTVLMQEIPEKHQGMMFGLIATLSNTLLGLSMLLTGCSLDVISPRLLGFLGGTSLLCISIFLFMTYSIRKSKEVSN
jgi:Na+/melibiose symporter-like transporter